MNELFNNSRILQVIWKWKSHLLIIGIIAILLSVLFTAPWFIKPKFKSTARLYPMNTRTFSKESESEQLMEILSSSDIKNQMINTFQLCKRYNIDPNDPYWKTKCLLKYDDNIQHKKSEYESIEITVLDTDPKMASNMADSLISFYNQKVNEMQHKHFAEKAATFLRELSKKKARVDSLTEQMDYLRENYGLLSYGVQVEQTTMGYMTALAEGADKDALQEIRDNMKNLETKGGDFLMLEKKLQMEVEIRDTLQNRYEKANRAAIQKLSYATVVEKPFPADKKSYPIRWLIVAICLLASEFLALVLVFLFESLTDSKYIKLGS